MTKYTFFSLIGCTTGSKKEIVEIAKKIGVSPEKLAFYNKNSLLPDTAVLSKIERFLGVSRYTIMLGLGLYDANLKELLSDNLEKIQQLLPEPDLSVKDRKGIKPAFQTKAGSLFQGDCLEVMNSLEDESVDMIFADPPFNLNKFYLSKINDSLPEEQYIQWCKNWLDESIRILKYGGSLFVWNLPKWNTILSAYLSERLLFKHWIAVDIKYSLPIQGKLYPSHYSLLYFIKGEKSSKFHPDRMPMDICKSCFKELKDYGGYKDKMNPKGINLADVWYDIPPVRHKKYKAREEANELSIKLLDRVIEMSTDPGDTVFDPFGGSGTTYIVSELKNRKWVGVEIGPVKSIVDRFAKIEEEANYLNLLRKDYNTLFPKASKKERTKRGIWTDDTFKDRSKQLSLIK